MRTQKDCLALNILGWNMNILSGKLMNLKLQPDEFTSRII